MSWHIFVTKSGQNYSVANTEKWTERILFFKCANAQQRNLLQFFLVRLRAVWEIDRRTRTVPIIIIIKMFKYQVRNISFPATRYSIENNAKLLDEGVKKTRKDQDFLSASSLLWFSAFFDCSFFKTIFIYGYFRNNLLFMIPVKFWR